MNLLLVEAAELQGDVVALDDRRADHLRRVLGVRIGQAVRAGVIGGGVGTAEVIADTGTALSLRLAIVEPAPPQLEVELVLAVPRPKVVSRVIEACAAFGVRRIDLTNAWRVDKSYLASPRLAPAALAHAARLGAEQGATTQLPELCVHRRLMALLDARFAGRGDATRLVAHPGAPTNARPGRAGPRSAAEGRRGVMIEQVARGGPVVLAIGPEGGWIERELDTLIARGFQPVSLGSPILRVETAVAAALAQLTLLQRLAER
ncbi:MAG TPA: RsmE family RNA methyltransferase [Kofleriaceae bacterium]|nr:RsmE family RNA methyltransferase [Kofleriaceae bacterium]